MITVNAGSSHFTIHMDTQMVQEEAMQQSFLEPSNMQRIAGS
jgi:hypothetical protein